MPTLLHKNMGVGSRIKRPVQFQDSCTIMLKLGIRLRALHDPAQESIPCRLGKLTEKDSSFEIDNCRCANIWTPNSYTIDPACTLPLLVHKNIRIRHKTTSLAQCQHSYTRIWKWGQGFQALYRSKTRPQ
jgi:hypothetical protein